MNPDSDFRPFQRYLAALLAVFLLGPTASAQPGEASRAKKRFMEGLDAPGVEERVEAVRTLVATGLPEAMSWMQQGLDGALKNRRKHFGRFQKLADEIREVQSGSRKLDRQARLEKLADLKEEQNKTRDLLNQDESVIQALRQGMGRLLSGLPTEIRDKSILPLIRRLRGARKTEDRTAHIVTLGYLKGASARNVLIQLLKAREPETRIAALDALGRQQDPAAATAAARCLADVFWQVRAAAVHALARMGGRDAVEGLINALGKSEGRTLQDIFQALTRLTGKNFRENGALWRKWWVKHKAGYTGPPVAENMDEAKKKRPAKRPKAASSKHSTPEGWKTRTGGTSFYGIQTRSKRLIYILDMSGSMLRSLTPPSSRQTGRSGMGAIGNRKIDQAQSELRTSITALPEDATFNIVFYHHEIFVWSKGQVKASPQNKEKAIDWAESMIAAGATNIFDALERAFSLAGRGTFDRHYAIAADTFYLMSDGRANRGRFTRGDDMRREVARLNRFQKVVIHSIALGGDADVGFMHGLAKDTGGQFVHYGVRGRNR